MKDLNDLCKNIFIFCLTMISQAIKLQKAELCQSIGEIDFIEIHAFGAQPKTPSPLSDPAGYRREQERVRAEYAKAYRNFFKEQCPENGVPARFTVHVVDFPDEAASYEFYAVGLLQGRH